jgi:hypothetical protein
VSLPDEMGSVLRFQIQPQDKKLSEADIRRLLEEATREAEAAARQEHAVSAQLQVPGAFGGVGETLIIVHLLLPYLNPLLPYLQEAGKFVVEGTLTAAGEYFFKQYLAPRLRQRNLLPSEVKVETEVPAQPKDPAKGESAKGAKPPKPAKPSKPPRRKS